MFTNEFPKLREFRVGPDSDERNIHLCKFITLHPQLERLHVDRISENEDISLIATHLLKLTELKLSSIFPSHFSVNVPEEYFNQLAELNSLKTLILSYFSKDKLKITSLIKSMVIANIQLESLSLSGFQYDREIFQNVSQLKSITTIKISKLMSTFTLKSLYICFKCKSSCLKNIKKLQLSRKRCLSSLV